MRQSRRNVKQLNDGPDKPGKPKEFTFDKESVTSKSVWLSWKPGPKRGSEHMFNLIWYTDDGNKRCVDIPHNGRDVMHYKLERLLEATNYNVKIFAECNTVKLECDTEVRFNTKDSYEDEICCENCNKTGASHASRAYCLLHGFYLCLKCLDKEHTNKECVLLWNTDDTKAKDHRLCCKDFYKHDYLHLKGVCQTCKLFICSQCIEKHEHTGCTSHQQLRGPRNTRARMCCRQNKTTGGTETVDFCMQCKTFICASCLKHHCTHLVISNVTDVMNAETELCCELNSKAKGHERDDFCIQCETFICESCLTGHNNHLFISTFT
ncbi:uncharacterized protein LOC132736295, partial [Ruditapes philippinarum]|uniref:uncharacterized protein LOC132736295 n=1 Tax=Ruditapes philippinarum TaxID=129788 RepID=UPI00295BC1D9